MNAPTNLTYAARTSLYSDLRDIKHRAFQASRGLPMTLPAGKTDEKAQLVSDVEYLLEALEEMADITIP